MILGTTKNTMKSKIKLLQVYLLLLIIAIYEKTTLLFLCVFIETVDGEEDPKLIGIEIALTDPYGDYEESDSVRANDFFEIKPSGLGVGSGSGLYFKEDQPKGTRMWYWGKVVLSNHTLTPLEEERACWMKGVVAIIEGSKVELTLICIGSRGCAASYANDWGPQEANALYEFNDDWMTIDEEGKVVKLAGSPMFLTLTRGVKAGEEAKVYYKDEYWMDKNKIDPPAVELFS